jgi:hypothetical protein
MVGGGRLGRGLADFGYVGLRLGARQCRWVVFSSSISIHDSGAARGLSRHRGH